jgi:hypothetical protein
MDRRLALPFGRRRQGEGEYQSRYIRQTLFRQTGTRLWLDRNEAADTM